MCVSVQVYNDEVKMDEANPMKIAMLNTANGVYGVCILYIRCHFGDIQSTYRLKETRRGG